jgi:hypothetical protein
VTLKNIKLKSIITHIVIIFLFLITKTAYAYEDSDTIGLSNFSFSSYLGNGFYTASGQQVFVLHLPLQHTIKEKTDREAGWVLNLPLTIGYINFDNVKVHDLVDLNDVATLTFLPGIEYQYPVLPDWTLIPFADYGFAHEFNHTANVLVTGIGIKSYADFHLKNGTLTLGNRLLYARERSRDSDDDSDYSLVETGINYQVASHYSLDNKPIYLNFYYINFYYPNDLILFERTTTPVKVGVENEIGFTVSNMPDFLSFENPQIGIGIRTGDGVTAYRLVFGMPF